MKKIGFIFVLHGIVFTIFMILNTLINDYVYAFLESFIHLAWLVSVCDLFVSGFLYVGIYTVVYFLYKYVIVRVKKEILNVKGTWYHVHIKKNDEGVIKADFLRAGETEITQDLYDLKFSAVNYSYKLDESGKVVKEDDMRSNTGWNSWAVDWDGKDKIITCFKAKTAVKVGNEYTNRHGIHRLTVAEDRQTMSGDFADEYPSCNRGEIYFFRSQEKMEEFIKNFLSKNQ